MEDNFIITISGEQIGSVDDSESFELTTEGSFYVSPAGGTVIKYSDGDDPETYKAYETSFTVEPDRIILNRTSWSGAEMIFDIDNRTHFLYETPFGAVAMGVNTESIDKDLETVGGDLNIIYSLDIDNIVVCRNRFKINVKKAGISKNNFPGKS